MKPAWNLKHEIKKKIHSQNRREKKKNVTNENEKIINLSLEMTLTAWNYIKRSQTAEENENEGNKQTNW